MAKTTGALMSVKASGKFADTIVYASWKGIDYARQWVKPQNPQTANQMLQRGSFSAAVDCFHAGGAGYKTTWDNAASGMGLSGFNYFVQQYLKQDCASLDVCPPTVPGA